jgi:flagellar biosynthesis protein FlhG
MLLTISGQRDNYTLMARHKTIWSVGGGKGGIGKSIATANIGCALAKRGKEVLLVDADLGGANLHTYFGIRFPQRGLDDFLKGRARTLEEASIPTGVEGLRLISGGGEFLGVANPAYSRKHRLINHIKGLEADYIIADLGAGSSYNVLDFFAVSNEGIVVLVPEPAAIQNTYIFLKSFVYRRLTRLFKDDPAVLKLIDEATDPKSPESVKTFSDLCERISRVDYPSAVRALTEVKGFRPKILLNMAASKDDLKVVEAFRSAASTFLSLSTDFIGTIYSRPGIKAAARSMRPFMLDESAVDARRDMETVIASLLKPRALEAAPAAGAAAETSMGGPAGDEGGEGWGGGGAPEVFGFNDNVDHNDTVVHVQTEVSGGGGGGRVDTVIYHGGRIFFSKRSWGEELSGVAASKDGLKGFAARQHKAAIAAVKMNKISLEGLGK